ncbi:unnamed protein product [Prorocentrum cordatum]|uniref:Mono(ADP-ribosyl)transferase n=1 Tax=Prorocentrum cordatum TaxID=2364126 RepID=A0ABN9VTU9_9DINO|nr:unnamed protein product [Polarella glacialis]
MAVLLAASAPAAGAEQGQACLGAVDRELHHLYHDAFMKWGDPELVREFHSLGPGRQRSVLSTLREHVEDRYRDLVASRAFRCAAEGDGDPLDAAERAAAAGRAGGGGGGGAPCCLQLALCRAVGRRLVDPRRGRRAGAAAAERLLRELKDGAVPRFGRGASGLALGEQQQEAEALWRRGRAGVEAGGFCTARRRPCGLRAPGEPVDLSKAYPVGWRELSLFSAHEGAFMEGTLITRSRACPPRAT